MNISRTNNESTMSADKEKEAIRVFLIGKRPRKPANKQTKCDLCLKSFQYKNPDNIINKNTVEMILQSFLIPNNKSSPLKFSSTLCSDCLDSFAKLTDLFLELEILRQEFINLRINLGRQIIAKSLGLSGDKWEEEIKLTENIFPSCLEQRNEISESLSKDENNSPKLAIEEEKETVEKRQDLKSTEVCHSFSMTK